MNGERLSWRDPDGFVLKVQGRILRAVSPEKALQTRELLRAEWLQEQIARNVIPGTRELEELPTGVEPLPGWLWLEHDRLEFPCHAHEITALQLYDSGALTLRLAREAIRHGWVLKDASAWNVLHDRGRPVFVDLLSFDRVQTTDVWLAYGQFARHFLLPLLLYRRLGITPAEIFLGHRDGVTPEQGYRLLKGASLLSASALEFVVLPTLLAGAGTRRIARQSLESGPAKRDPATARQRIANTLERLQRVLDRLRPDREAGAKSVWMRYEQERSHYSDADLAAKRSFVKDHLGDCRSVLDLGANAGEFSLIAAQSGKTVVAADADHPALSRLYSRIRDTGDRITPVLLNIGRPTPAIGWKNKEIESFIDRASNAFDCVLMLGLVHHLIVGERATIPMLADLLRGLNPKRVIIEWVDRRDPKFQQLAGLNQELYSGVTLEQFEECVGSQFRLTAKLTLPCITRTLYLWER